MTLQKMSLYVIEKLCYVYEGGNKSNINNTQKIMNDIYEFSHVFSNCRNKHVDWRQKLRKNYKEFKRGEMHEKTN